MNLLDMIIVVILSFCLIRGLFRGIVKELSSIIGVFGGFYAAYTYYTVLACLISKWIPNLLYNKIISFFIIFCAVFIIISVIGIIIKYILNISFMAWIDRVFGSVFGLVKGGLIVSVIVLVLTVFLEKNSPVVKKSILAPYVTLMSEKIVKITPENMKKKYDNKLNEFKKGWKRQ